MAARTSARASHRRPDALKGVTHHRRRHCHQLTLHRARYPPSEVILSGGAENPITQEGRKRNVTRTLEIRIHFAGYDERPRTDQERTTVALAGPNSDLVSDHLRHRPTSLAAASLDRNYPGPLVPLPRDPRTGTRQGLTAIYDHRSFTM